MLWATSASISVCNAFLDPKQEIIHDLQRGRRLGTQGGGFSRLRQLKRGRLRTFGVRVVVDQHNEGLLSIVGGEFESAGCGESDGAVANSCV